MKASCRIERAILVMVALLLWSPAAPAAESAPGDSTAVSDSLIFKPLPEDSEQPDEPLVLNAYSGRRRTYYGDDLISEPGTGPGGFYGFDVVGDYNRVDRVRLGLRYEIQPRDATLPRIGARAEYAFQRDRALYGVQLEQPFPKHAPLAIGVSMMRITDHFDLQHTDDVENSLTLAVDHMDYRDYFERESYGAYLSYRIPRITTASIRYRTDTFRSLPDEGKPWSVFDEDEPIRVNPAIDDGEARLVAWRFERQRYRHPGSESGFYHWIDIERAGRGMGGDFSYVRLLADLRSVVRLSPATTLALRGVAGHNASGTLPIQRQFTLGGVDGLRAHPNARYRADQIVLAQLEYTVGLWRLRSEYFDGGLHAIVFLDSGAAWSNPANEFDPDRQHFQTDAGFGLSTSEDNVRVYFAKNLLEPDSDFLVTVRLQRPF